MAYIKLNNQLLNTNAIYYVDTNPGTLITINSKKGIQQISGDEWDNIKADIIACNNFKEIPNYGYVNLNLVVDVWKTDDNYYNIKFENFTKNLALNPTNTPGLDDTVFTEVKAYVEATGGGGGGTTNYDALSNKPQIGGVTLTGNKTADQFGLASKTDLTAETTARTAKDTELETAIQGKQDTLTAGDGINITTNEIKVDETIVATKAEVGDITQLGTTKKDSIVNAINEIKDSQAQGGYTLPEATDAVLGGVTIGDGIAVANGKISLDLTAALEDSTVKAPSSKAVKDALDGAGKIDGATLDGTDVTVNNKKLEITLPKAKGAILGIAKAGEGLKDGATDGEIAVDETKIVMKADIDTTALTEDDTKVPSSKLAKEQLEAKLNKVIPTLTAGENYKAKQIAFKDNKLVRVIKDITSYDETANVNDISVFIDDINSVDYSFIHNFINASAVKANTYVFKDGSFYQAIVDIATVAEADLEDAAKFKVIYKHADFTLPISSSTVLGGVKIGDGILVDAQDGTISLDKSKLSVIEYQDADQVINKGQLVIHANDLYICKANIAATAGWATDEVNMEAVDTNNSEIEVVDYDTVAQNDEIKKGKIIVYNNKIYLAKETFNKSATFTDDEAHLIETALQIDLANFYTKVESDNLLATKAAISVPTLTAGQSYKVGQLVQKADGYLAKVKLEITAYDETNDADKVEPIADFTGYVKEDKLNEELAKKADLVLPTIAVGQAYKANQLAVKDNLLVRVKEEIAAYAEDTDKAKLENIGYLPTATADVLGGIKLGNGLEDAAADGIVSVKAKADGGLTVADTGVEVDTNIIAKKELIGELTTLTTTAKNDTVSAINELDKILKDNFAFNGTSLIWTQTAYDAIAAKEDKIYFIKG